MNEFQSTGRSGKRKLQDDSKPNPCHQIAKQRAVTNIIRISTPQGHIECLREGISRATKCVLITSYGVDHDMLVACNLYPLLTCAKQRGVNIYIYNTDTKDTDHQASIFFRRHNIAYDEAFTHSKIFAVDNSVVTIGSYNWLSKDNMWENASLRFSGSECAELIRLIWEDLKYYRNLQFENLRQIEQYELDHEDTEPERWKLDNYTELHYINCLEAHQQFIVNAFENAQFKIILCCPFINSHSGYQKDFTKKLLNQTLTRKVHIFFVCRNNDHNLSDFREYLGSLLYSPFMHVVTMPNIHLKSVLVDDEMIAEGSFNWLSASRDDDSPYHNHEVTLMLYGNGSRNSIQNFYSSPIGIEIMKVSSDRNTIRDDDDHGVVISTSRSNEIPVRAAPPQLSNQSSNETTNTQRNNYWWLRLDWRISAEGNPYLNVPKKDYQGTHNIVILKGCRANFYSAVIDKVILDRWYGSEDEAKLAARDRLESLL